jgi:phage terminase large subunit-like protein
MSSMVDQLVASLMAQPGFDPAKFDPQIMTGAFDDHLFDEIYEDLMIEREESLVSRFDQLFPDTGPYRRELYPKHTLFFRAGRFRMERLFKAANRVGKTVAGGYECTAHATGRYPHWWQGRRFHHPTNGWAAGDTNETTRDIIQKELFGEVAWDGNRKSFDGSGMIPRPLIGPVTWKRGVADLADIVKVKHIDESGEWSGGWSRIGLKSYDQGRRVFQGTAKHWIWLDEEVPEPVYGECIIRLMTTKGLMIMTFTPLQGLTPLINSFLAATAIEDDE